MATNFTNLFEGTYTHNGSDIHLMQESPAYIRVDGRMRAVKGTDISKEDIDDLLKRIMPDDLRNNLKDKGGADFAWQLDDVTELRGARLLIGIDRTAQFALAVQLQLEFCDPATKPPEFLLDRFFRTIDFEIRHAILQG